MEDASALDCTPSPGQRGCMWAERGAVPHVGAGGAGAGAGAGAGTSPRTPAPGLQLSPGPYMLAAAVPWLTVESPSLKMPTDSWILHCKG